jgi:Tol biopolymer transport system component
LEANAYRPAISRSGHHLAYVHSFTHRSIWRTAAPRLESSADTRGAKRLQPLNQTTPLIYSTRDDDSPEFSPDGKKIVFGSNRSGSLEIWVCDADGSNAVQLTSFGGPDVTTPRWSPDGGRIAFDSNAAGGFDIYVVGATGGKPQRMTTHPANDGNPSWSRDGQWIYFDSARTGEQQVWKMPASGGEAIQLTRDGGFGPRESPDGKFLYYTKALGDSSLWRIPIGGGAAAKVLEHVNWYQDLAIMDKGIYFISWQEANPSIRFLRFDTNEISIIAGFEKPLDHGLTVSPDGKWILYSQVEQEGSELMLVENFR